LLKQPTSQGLVLAIPHLQCRVIHVQFASPINVARNFSARNIQHESTNTVSTITYIPLSTSEYNNFLCSCILFLVKTMGCKTEPRHLLPRSKSSKIQISSSIQTSRSTTPKTTTNSAQREIRHLPPRTNRNRLGTLTPFF
jgi:hypothetical protein